ncbi:meiosis-specific protein MEI4 [Astyanax mexicanus]|uniref:Meiosis-specific protein MEI4 n=1 Tax=Astyanax mexicanus TaxID=7994 RepID=A0A8T2MEG9_ASTMX|nr:meiosis-specific protein MEI4 [Astyanax mexicanus]
MTTYPCRGKATWDLRTAKLAVAVAIIKSKPPGVSGRQHAEILAARLKKQEETWKAKAEDLKEEVLQLRQELLLTKLLSKPRKSAEAERGDDVLKLLYQDPTDAQLSESDSGCGTSNNTQTLHPTPDLLDVPTPCHTSTVPSSSIHSSHSCVSFPCSTGTLEHALSKRMQFLQHLSGLRRWSGPALVVDGDGAVVWDSVLYLLSSVIEAFKQASGNKALPDPPLLLQASRAAAQALEQGRPSAQHLGQMEDLLKELLDLLLSNSELNKFAVQKTLTECLISLGGSSTFRSVLVRLLLSHINHLAGHLWTSCQGSSDGQQQQQVHWSRYENSIYLFRLLEQLAVVRPGRGAETEHRDLQAQLERYVLPLSDEFPLFALYLWRIGALFNPTSTAGTSAQSFSSQSTFNP